MDRLISKIYFSPFPFIGIGIALIIALIFKKFKFSNTWITYLIDFLIIISPSLYELFVETDLYEDGYGMIMIVYFFMIVGLIPIQLIVNKIILGKI